MKKILLIILPAVIAFVFASVYFFANGQDKKNGPVVCFEKNCYAVETAVTAEERARGLMFRESIDRGSGMLFEFEQEGVYSFWMKNTLAPLDIVWISADKKIVFISKNTPPCVGDICLPVNPEKNARYVLEINAGETDRIGAKIGDAVVIKQ